MNDECGAAGRARRELRRHYEGALLFHGMVCPVRYIIDGASGRLLMTVEPGAAEGGDMTLLVPDEQEGAAQLLLSVSPAAPGGGDAGAASDRWTAYHGGTGAVGAGRPRSEWMWGRIEAVKLEGEVCDGGEVGRPNALRAVEPRLCRELNARREAIADACRRETGLAVESPLVVGVDEGGIDVRARFGIVRLEFLREAGSEAAAAEEIGRLLHEGPRP